MKKQGFTLIELLVVIAIIGLLSTLAVVALNSARLKARDAKRVFDVQQVQTALELYFNDQQGYPAGTGTLGTGSFSCLGTDGWGPAGCAGAYMGQVPVNPTPNGADYTYASDGTSGTYTITFEIEGQTGALAPGVHTASQDGIE